jgi:hypothetical protein
VDSVTVGPSGELLCFPELPMTAEGSKADTV